MCSHESKSVSHFSLIADITGHCPSIEDNAKESGALFVAVAKT